MHKILSLILFSATVIGFSQNKSEPDSLVKNKVNEFIKRNRINVDSSLKKEFIDFAISKAKKNKQGSICKRQKNISPASNQVLYSKYLHLPHGLKGYFDFEEGLECSKKLNKPNLVYFVGHGSIKSREMEAYVWSDPEILQILKEKYIITALYTDDKFQLFKEKQIESNINGKLLKRIGDKALYYQKLKFKDSIQPAYYIINSKEELQVEPYHYNLSIDAYKKFLKKGLEKF